MFPKGPMVGAALGGIEGWSEGARLTLGTSDGAAVGTPRVGEEVGTLLGSMMQ